MSDRKNLFIKWFITFSAILAGSAVAAYKGLFTIIVSGDVSHLSSIIAGLFLGFSALAGKLSYDLSRDDASGLLTKFGKPTLKRRLKILNFMANTFFALGLMGTVIGFCYMMRGTLNPNADVSTIITQLKIGSSTKLYTTLAGLVSSLLLQLQILMIELELVEEKLKDKNEDF